MEVLDYNKLKIFKAVADLKSFSKAAEFLFLSQPTVTLQIKKIENHLNVTLFERTKEGIKLTPEGKILYKHATKILEDYSVLEEDIYSLGKKLDTSLIIGASTTVGEYFLPPLIAKFLKNKENLNINLFIGNSKEVEEGILSKRFYIAFVEDEIISNKLNTIDIYEDEIIFLASEKADIPSYIDKKDVKYYKFVFREKGSGTRNIVEKHLIDKNIKIYPEIEMGSSKAIVNFVANSDYIGFASKLIAKDYLKNKVLRKIQIDNINIHRKFTCITQKNIRLPSAEREFLNFVLNNSTL